MVAAAILDFHFMCIWPFRRADSVYLCSVPDLVQLFIIVTGIDARLMTSREFTSGFDFWSSGHLRMALMHLTIKFGAGVFIQSGVIIIFSKIKDGGRRHLAFVWVNHCTTHEASLVVRTSDSNVVMIG